MEARVANPTIEVPEPEMASPEAVQPRTAVATPVATESKTHVARFVTSASGKRAFDVVDERIKDTAVAEKVISASSNVCGCCKLARRTSGLVAAFSPSLPTTILGAPWCEPLLVVRDVCNRMQVCN